MTLPRSRGADVSTPDELIGVTVTAAAISVE
jgi:hypothetical protein